MLQIKVNLTEGQKAAVENRALCEAGMRIAYDDLYPDDRGIYIACTPTRVLTATIRPEARP